MTGAAGYFAYLRKRSLAALAYRRLWLYPHLCRELTGRVLDVGCGIGDFLRYRPGTVGTDVDAEAVAWCRGLGLDAHRMLPDQLPFDDAGFDGAVLDNVLEHLASPAALLSEIRRVLRASATLLVGVPGRRGYHADPDHKVHYDETALRTTVARAGFSCQRIIHMPFPSRLLEARLRQYCLYGVFRRIGHGQSQDLRCGVSCAAADKDFIKI